ncbi:DUF885 domain-containing protein [Pseudoxanthomonas broegbernensis]|uniref:DUF885 domain-containing protein n=1 Tax=Pseudoxanthomonas broegbernensis TaxID=83619 RepID=A0A7V8K875_9GAMM|nr:DUF885 domain-containing protein [Pseudoxanthomonas broegbernensis]MBB6064774.1 uncharacterized protein (DUF885 family) [Pseudoxanthomonas broegbernensis]
MPAPRSRWLAMPLALLLAASAPAAEAAPAKAKRPAAARQATVQDKAGKLQRLYADYWEAALKLNPLQATFQGEARYNDHLPNYLSAAFRQRSHELTAEWLGKVEAVGEEGLEGQDLLSYRIFVRNARDALEGERFPGWMLPVSPFNNPATLVAMLGSGASAQPFRTVADYDAWARRARDVPALFDQAIANMREGMAAGVVQPRPLMEKVLPQLDALIRPSAEETLFWAPVRNMPADFPEAERTRLDAEYRRLIETRLMPAYRRLRGFIATEYLPATRASAGLDALPGGAQWYAYNVRQSTTIDLPAERIHRMGQEQVKHIHGQIQALMKQARFRGSMPKFFRFMQQDARFRFADEAAQLARYQALQAQVEERMPRLFSLLPRTGLEIRPTEPYRAPSAPAGAYTPPGESGPGIFYVNTHDLPRRRTWEAEVLFLHEAIPGHHVQLALQQELHDLPAFRRYGGEAAFTEGWGLYAESLGEDLGLHEDAYSRFGRLQNELLRAIRLVVDTGLHSQGWTREQVIDYMTSNSAIGRDEAAAETERYLAMPGQALAYWIGMMKIAELRQRAQAALGERFDLRAFHAEVLKDGSVPLDVLEAKIDAWLDAQRDRAEQAPAPGAPGAKAGDPEAAEAAEAAQP